MRPAKLLLGSHEPTPQACFTPIVKFYRYSLRSEFANLAEYVPP